MSLRLTLLILLYLASGHQVASGQPFARLNPAPDTNYIQDLSHKLALRLYGSRKFTGYKLGQFGNKRVIYYPNSNINVGVGASYKFLNINIGFPAPFINNDKDKYGKTRFLDLQSYIYMGKLTIDLYAQFYNGYYLANNEVLATTPPNGYLQRPDIKTKTIGTTVEYIFNHKKFSYRSIYLQNELQKKSAGSFLAGGGVHYVNMRADSSVIPTTIADKDFFNGAHFNQSDFINLTANFGYAHNFVIAGHFFVMGSLLGGVGGNYMQLTNVPSGTGNEGINLNLTATVRVGAGYNSERFFAGVHYVNYITANAAPIAHAWQQYEAGNLRVSVVRRLDVKKPLPKPLDKLFDADLPPVTN